MEGSHTYTYPHTPKIKLIFVFNVNERKCFIYLLRSTDMYLSLLIFSFYTCAIHYKFGHPDSAFLSYNATLDTICEMWFMTY